MASRRAESHPNWRTKRGLTQSLSFARPRHALLAPIVSNFFQAMDVGISVWTRGDWYDLYARPFALDPARFEPEHGVEAERVRYNMQSVERARRERRAVVGRHRGFMDVFAPVGGSRKPDAVLVAGPVATSKPSSIELLERWRSLTGRLGHPSDPEFAHYLMAARSTLLLDLEQQKAFRRLVECLATLMTPSADARLLIVEAQALRDILVRARAAERMWDVAQTMIDEKTSRIWASPNFANRLRALGFERFPELVAVGLFVNAAADSEPVDELLRCDAFQRAAVELCSAQGAGSGRIGDHGVTFLYATRGGTDRSRRRLLDLTDAAAMLARRRFGLVLHVGISNASGSLSDQYQRALGAAESAVSKGLHLVESTDSAGATPFLGGLRRELAADFDVNPRAVPARFDRYLEAVAIRSGYQLERARAHLEAGFERIVEVAEDRGLIDPKTLAAQVARLDRAATEARTLNELFSAYRLAVSDLVDSVADPRAAPRDHALDRAEEHARKHYAEPLGLDRIARVAGYAPKYFSELFRKKQGVTFESYLSSLRIERAKQLLSGTDLNLQRVAQLSGFGTGNYLGRVFRRATGETPIAYRRRVHRDLGGDPVEVGTVMNPPSSTSLR